MTDEQRKRVMDIYAKTQPTTEDVAYLVDLIWDLSSGLDAALTTLVLDGPR